MADKPVTREEKYLAYLTGDYKGEFPNPITRKEKYLYELCLKGIGGEISPEEIKAAVNEYLEKNPVNPGATTEQAQQIEQNKTDITSLKTEASSLKEDLSGKIDKPSTAPEVGKILKVKAVNDDGTFVCEWADVPSGGGGVDDVQINGTSIVQDSVANIPIADATNKLGLVLISGYGIQSFSGDLALIPSNKSIIDNRNTYLPLATYGALTNGQIDYAVKAAMCDGKGEAWTADEQAAARARMGIPEGYELIVDATIEEEVSSHLFTLPKSCSDILIFVKLGSEGYQGDFQFKLFEDFFATIRTPYFYLHAVSLGDKIKRIDSFAQTEINLNYGGYVSTRFLKLSNPIQKTYMFKSYYTFGVGANIKIWGR